MDIHSFYDEIFHVDRKLKYFDENSSRYNIWCNTSHGLSMISHDYVLKQELLFKLEMKSVVDFWEIEKQFHIISKYFYIYMKFSCFWLFYQKSTNPHK